MSGDHPDYTIIKISQNTAKSERPIAKADVKNSQEVQIIIVVEVLGTVTKGLLKGQ